MAGEPQLMNIQSLSAFAWPVAVVVVIIFAAWWLCSDIRPIVAGVISGLAAHAQRQAPAYGVAFLLGLAGSLGALVEVAEKLGWVYVAAFAKVASPFVAAVLGFIMRGGFTSRADQTTPPFMSGGPKT